MQEVGFPAGVVNIVPGYGHTAGARLAEHPDVKKIAFTGSTATGRRIVQASASNLKKVQLELGGKGPNIVFADAIIPAAVGGSAWAIFHNQGQACIAGSRLILHEKIADEFLERFIALAKSIRLGDPARRGDRDGAAHLQAASGARPLLRRASRARKAARFSPAAKRPSARISARGCFVEPTVVRAKMSDTVNQEEVFGPFVDGHDLLGRRRGARHGQRRALRSRRGPMDSNLSRAHKMAREINAGMVWVNCYKVVHPGSPFGGVGESGYGREMGFEAMREYTHAKSVWINVDAQVPPHYPR